MPQRTIRKPATRPQRTARSVQPCERINRDDAPALGLRRVLTQACHDLYGTKDVQNVITASYVWMADQIGHLTLGLIPTLLACWTLHLWWRGGGDLDALVDAGIALAIFGYWLEKELTDLRDTRAEAGCVFAFDRADLVWNVKTALQYFAIGGALAWAGCVSGWLFLAVLPVALWLAAVVAFWWLRRKLAFQQAGLPFLYRLANFRTALPQAARDAVAAVANLRDAPVSMLAVWLGRDSAPQNHPARRHLLVCGPVGAGKTSLCAGIGTEFAFGLGLGRYLSAADLVEYAAADGDPAVADYDDGRILWPWNGADLLIVDDVDVTVRRADGRTIQLVAPATLDAALRRADGHSPLEALGAKRTVWAISDVAQANGWRQVIAGLLGLDAEAIQVIDLSSQTTTPAPAAAEPQPTST